MFWRKRQEPIELPALDISDVPIHGPDGPAPSRFNLQADWEALGEEAWEILNRRRMQDIFAEPDSSTCEFDRYMALRARSSSRYRDEVFIGLQHSLEYGACRPVFVPKKVFERHAYILGGSGSGKTSQALAQLLLQLSEAPTVMPRHGPPYPPLLIIDLKQTGDRYLRALAEMIARRRGKRLLFFSNDPDYESLTFDPFYCLRSIKYPLKLSETILNALSMVYREGYGSDFFTAEQYNVLRKAIYDRNIKTLDQLVKRIEQLTSKGGPHFDARGLFSAIVPLTMALHLHTDGSPLAPEQQIDFERFVEQGDILYVHLDSRGLKLLSREIGKLMLFGLLETASQREKEGRKVQMYVLIDEFHRLAAQNIIEMFEDARGAGVGFILAHQSSSSLKTREEDLYGILFENCSFKQCLTLEDPNVIELFRLVSGRATEMRYGGGATRTDGSQTTEGWSHQNSLGSAFSRTYRVSILGAELAQVSTGATDGESAGQSESRSQSDGLSESSTWKEEKIPALTPEMITAVNDRNLLSLVHVKGAGDDCLTPLQGIPTLVQGLYPFTQEQAGSLSDEKWPIRQVDPDDYYRKGRLEDSFPPADATPKKSEESPDETPDLSPPVEPIASTESNEGDHRALLARLKAMFQRFHGHVIDEALTVVLFGRQHGLSAEQAVELARSAGFPVENRDAVLTPPQVRALRSLIEKVRGEGPA